MGISIFPEFEGRIYRNPYVRGFHAGVAVHIPFNLVKYALNKLLCTLRCVRVDSWITTYILYAYTYTYTYTYTNTYTYTYRYTYRYTYTYTYTYTHINGYILYTKGLQLWLFLLITDYSMVVSSHSIFCSSQLGSW